MPTYAPQRIKADALEIGRLSGRFTPGQKLRFAQRESLEGLAQLCGLSEALAEKANDVDLIGIWQVAEKDGAGAIRTAERVRLRLDDVLFAGTPPVTEPRLDHVTPTPRPQEPAGPSLDVIKALVVKTVKEGALDPLQAALSTMHDELSASIDTLEARAMAEYEARVGDAVAKALREQTPTRLDVTTPANPEPKSLGLVHKKTPMIINALAAGVNVYLHGPAGSGKTTAAQKCADAFNTQFYFAAKVESEYQLMGFKDAKGDTVHTPFRDAYENGGLFLFDEMDASSPSAVVALNAALANGVCPFPDKIITRHKDFKVIGAGNTKLTGATRAYAGRNQLDAASIDRFAFIEFGYDDDLERALATDQSWCRYVQRVRAVVAERGLNHLVTPRATYDGCKLLATGFDKDTVAGMVVYKGLDADTRTQIERAM